MRDDMPKPETQGKDLQWHIQWTANRESDGIWYAPVDPHKPLLLGHVVLWVVASSTVGTCVGVTIMKLVGVL